MDEPTVVAELRQREHPWQKPEKYVVSMSDGEIVTYVPERTCTPVYDSYPPLCSVCNKTLMTGDNYCSKCGAKVVDSI